MERAAWWQKETRSTIGRALAIICIILLLSVVTAWAELAWQPAVLFALFVGFLLERVIGAIFIRGPITWRTDLLMIGASLLYPALVAVILRLACATSIAPNLAGCDPVLLRRLLLGNFYFSAIGLLGAWAARRFDLWRSNRS